MPDAVAIARATAADLPAVVDLCMLVEAQHQAYNPARWTTRPGIREGYLRWLTSHLADPNMLILAAKTAGPQPQVVGTLLGAIETEIPIYTYDRYAFIHDLAVAASHRRHGIARRLLAEARTWAKALGLPHLRLMVAAQNPEAEALFRAAGFQETYHEMILPL